MVRAMGMDGPNLEALFVDPNHHGVGIGREMIRHALHLHAEITTTVNEQNEQASGFYTRVGFVPIGRMDFDEEGRPYPIVKLRLASQGYKK